MNQPSKKIKIFIDGHTFGKELQGTQTFIRGLYTTLHNRFDDLDLFVGAYDAASIRSELPFINHDNIYQYKKRLTGISRFMYDIPAILRRQRFDFAHFQYISPTPVQPCKFIVTLHDVLFKDYATEFSWLYRMSRNTLFRRSFRRAAVKTTVSNYSRDRIAAHYNISPNEINVIPNGVNAQYGKSYNREDAASFVKQKYGAENFILYVSRIEPRKNQLLLLKRYLALELDKKNISLVLIGNESLPVKELSDTLGSLSWDQLQHVHWFRAVSNEDLEAFYRAARLFVYMSKAEGFGIPPLEAALCGAPVLCSGATAMQDFTFFDPYRFNIDNEDELDNKMLWLLHNPPHESFRQNIIRKINEQYALETTADKFYSLLKKHSEE